MQNYDFYVFFFPYFFSFYIAAPLSLCTCCAVEVFNFTADQVAEINVEGRDLLSITGSDWWGYVKPITKLGWFEWIGAAIFIWGWVHQCRCHAILVSLTSCFYLLIVLTLSLKMHHWLINEFSISGTSVCLINQL